MKKMRKKSKKQRIIYREPPMKYNVALHKFEVDLPTIKKSHTENKIQVNPLIIIILIIVIVMMFYLSYRIY